MRWKPVRSTVALIVLCVTLGPISVPTGADTNDAEGPVLSALNIMQTAYEEGDPLDATVTVDDASDLNQVTLYFNRVGGAGSIYASTFGGPPRTVVIDTPIPHVQQGTYVLEYAYAYDQWGNFGVNTFGELPVEARTITVGDPHHPGDVSGPEFSDLVLLSNAYDEGDMLQATIQVADASQLNQVTLYFNRAGGGGSIYASSYGRTPGLIVFESVIPHVQQGTYILEFAYGYDEWGNFGHNSLSGLPLSARSFSVGDPNAPADLEGPVLTDLVLGATAYLPGDPIDAQIHAADASAVTQTTLYFKRTGGGGEVYLSAPSGDPGTVVFPGPFPTVQQGAYVLEYAYAFDEWGNFGVNWFSELPQQERTIHVCGPDLPDADATAAGEPLANGWWSSPVEVTLTATGSCPIEAIEHAVNAGPWAVGDMVVLADDGIHDVAARATDIAARTGATRHLEVRIDATPPQATVVDPPAGALALGDTVIRVDATDATSGVALVTFFVDGVVRGADDTAPFEFTWDAGSEAAGPHLLRAEATDHAGHVGFSDEVEVYSVPTGLEGILATLPAS